MTLQKGMAACNDLWHGYLRSAKLRGLEFNLSKQEFLIITSKNCHYCGSPPSLLYNKTFSSGHKQAGKPKFNGGYKYNGIDRKNNDLGYVIDNCLPCCNSCNLIKGQMAYDKFLVFIKKIATQFQLNFK